MRTAMHKETGHFAEDASMRTKQRIVRVSARKRIGPIIVLLASWHRAGWHAITTNCATLGMSLASTQIPSIATDVERLFPWAFAGTSSGIIRHARQVHIATHKGLPKSIEERDQGLCRTLPHSRIPVQQKTSASRATIELVVLQITLFHVA